MKSGAQSGAQRTKRSHDISTGPKPVKSAYLLRQLLSWDCAVNRSLFLRAIYLVNFDQSLSPLSLNTGVKQSPCWT
jgi:hypothetical protein